MYRCIDLYMYMFAYVYIYTCVEIVDESNSAHPSENNFRASLVEPGQSTISKRARHHGGEIPTSWLAQKGKAKGHGESTTFY